MARNTVVPAQVMTVEDKIVGSLGMKQLILLGIGVIGSGCIFLMMVPTGKITALKLLVIIVLNIVTTCGAIRYKGELLLQWAAIGLAYMLRPRYWVYDKNTTYLRPVESADAPQTEIVPQEVAASTAEATHIPAVTIETQVQLNEFMSDPEKRVRFVNTRGGMKIVYTAETD